MIVVFAGLFNLFDWTSSVTYLLLKNALVFLKYSREKYVFTDTTGSNKDEWLASQWSRVERMEILFGVNVDIILYSKISLSYASMITYRFVKEH